MKVTQQVTREGDDLVLRVHEHPSGKLLGERVWKGAAKYLRPMAVKGYLSLMVPEKAGLDIKPS
jgi:hypothetical protein